MSDWNPWIFLSKGEEDQYVNSFCKGTKGILVDSNTFVWDDYDEYTPIVMRGILKKKIIHKCWRKDRPFYYIDTGYFGNEKTIANPNGWKYWHRIVKNDLQHQDEIIERPDDRFRLFRRRFRPFKKGGRKILLAAPDEKPMKFYGLNLDDWIEDTVAEIKKHTDRPVEVRRRDKQRADRLTNTLEEALDDDVFALVTYNSNAAVESIFHGIPTFTLADAHAAHPVSCRDLSKIDTPYYPSADKLYAWGCHLAYGQFHVNEMKTGKARKLLEEHWG